MRDVRFYDARNTSTRWACCCGFAHGYGCKAARTERYFLRLAFVVALVLAFWMGC